MSSGRYIKWKIRFRGQKTWWPRKKLYWINLHKWLYAIPPLEALSKGFKFYFAALYIAEPLRVAGWLPVHGQGQEIFVQDNDQMIAPNAERLRNYSVRVDF